MDYVFFLQLWGGVFLLLNKVFFWRAEYAGEGGDLEESRRWRIAAWAIYIAGLPPWIIIFFEWHNWIAGIVEASGFPAMFLGLVLALQKSETKKIPVWLDRLAFICIPFGFLFSIYDFGGFFVLNQWIEAMLALSFLAGTYLLTKENGKGYLWYIPMHIACAWLMWIQLYPWLCAQQIASLFFVYKAYVKNRERFVPSIQKIGYPQR